MKIEEGNIVISTDFDKDGEDSTKTTIFPGEGAEEVFKRGLKKEDVKIVDFELNESGIRIAIDTDRDGEPVIIHEAKFGEVMSETLSLFKK